MLERKVTAEPEITDAELQAIAKKMHEERLLELSNLQRRELSEAEHHSETNLAFIAYFHRLTELGGHTSFLPEEEERSLERGCEQQRIDDLKTIIKMREEKDISPIRRDELDQHLKQAGYTPGPKLRNLLELRLYPSYFDAYLAAEDLLQELTFAAAKSVCRFIAGACLTYVWPAIAETKRMVLRHYCPGANLRCLLRPECHDLGGRARRNGRSSHSIQR